MSARLALAWRCILWKGRDSHSDGRQWSGGVESGRRAVPSLSCADVASVARVQCRAIRSTHHSIEGPTGTFDYVSVGMVQGG